MVRVGPVGECHRGPRNLPRGQARAPELPAHQRVLVVTLDLHVLMFLPCQGSARQAVAPGHVRLSTQGGGEHACFSVCCILSGRKGEGAAWSAGPPDSELPLAVAADIQLQLKALNAPCICISRKLSGGKKEKQLKWSQPGPGDSSVCVCEREREIWKSCKMSCLM